MDMPIRVAYSYPSVLYQEKKWFFLVGTGLPGSQLYDSEEQVPLTKLVSQLYKTKYFTKLDVC